MDSNVCIRVLINCTHDRNVIFGLSYKYIFGLSYKYIFGLSYKYIFGLSYKY